jgi:hypothetical protein
LVFADFLVDEVLVDFLVEVGEVFVDFLAEVVEEVFVDFLVVDFLSIRLRIMSTPSFAAISAKGMESFPRSSINPEPDCLGGWRVLDMLDNFFI